MVPYSLYCQYFGQKLWTIQGIGCHLGLTGTYYGMYSFRMASIAVVYGKNWIVPKCKPLPLHGTPSRLKVFEPRAGMKCQHFYFFFISATEQVGCEWYYLTVGCYVAVPGGGLPPSLPLCPCSMAVLGLPLPLCPGMAVQTLSVKRCRLVCTLKVTAPGEAGRKTQLDRSFSLRTKHNKITTVVWQCWCISQYTLAICIPPNWCTQDLVRPS